MCCCQAPSKGIAALPLSAVFGVARARLLGSRGPASCARSRLRPAFFDFQERIVRARGRGRVTR